VQQVDKLFVCRIIKKQIIYTMIHAFMLVVLLGDAPLNIGAPMYFRSINDCNYYASRVVKKYGNYRYEDYLPKEHRSTAYCKPVYISEDTETLY
jgi:hypothetical protein